jgi:excisionase family DNA binding protein
LLYSFCVEKEVKIMENLLTVNEVAQAIGMTTFGVYGLVHKRQIPAVKISRRCLRFRPQEIEKWLQEKSQIVSQQSTHPKPSIRRGGPKKNGIVSGEYVNRLVDHARKEVLK